MSAPDSELSRYMIAPTATLRDAMAAIDANWREVVFVVDAGGIVVGSITDGDLRRGLLRGLSLDAPAIEVMTREYIWVDPRADRAGVLDLMRACSVRQIPVLDGARRLVGIHFLEALLGASAKPNVAVIMAGGEGRRLRPLTQARPKPMMPVAGRPILERIVLLLVGHGVRRIILSVNYLAEQIEQHFGDGERFGCAIEYLREDRPLGSGGALAMLPAGIDAPLLVMNGDLVTQIDVTRMLEFHSASGASATLAARHYPVEIPYGVVETREQRLASLVEKPTAHYLVNTGIYVLEPHLLARVPAGEFYPITTLFEQLLEEGRHVAVYRVEEDWLDVGRREDLGRANGIDS